MCVDPDDEQPQKPSRDDQLRIIRPGRDRVAQEEAKRDRWLRKNVPGYDDSDRRSDIVREPRDGAECDTDCQ